MERLTMDFFESQEVARRRTLWLVFAFLAAVVGVVAGVHLAGSAVAHLSGARNGAIHFSDPAAILATAGATLVVILLGTGIKTLQLSGGGEVVARDLGGRRVDPGTRDSDERRLVNVVEEMSIASGVPVPDIYVLEDEDSINAFAAGRGISDAVVGVTRGCLRHLTRDELQGVIAHEFSHILNGDMRLNFRLIGLVHGILVLSILGRVVMELALRVFRGSSDRKGLTPLGLAVLVGVSLLVIGSVGAFFGRVIKAAVSRQREFLADASAVQFTRQPDGLAGALKKIAALQGGSRVRHPRAEEASHLFFANGLRGGMRAGLLATHPPLEERIRALDPSWDGAGGAARRVTGGAGPGTARRPAAATARASAASALASPGYVRFDGPRPIHLEAAHRLVGGLPDLVERVVADRLGAQSLVLAVLLAQDETVRESEIAFLAGRLDEHAMRRTVDLHERVRGIHSREKFALLEMAIPALRRMSPEEYRRFGELTGGVIAADGHRSLFEYALEHMIRRHLDRFFAGGVEVASRHRHVRDVADEMALLLAVLAVHAGDGIGPLAAGDAAYQALSEEAGRAVTPPAGRNVSLEEIDAALARLEEAAPRIRRLFLSLAESLVVADGRLRSEEAELLRAMADAIGSPVPPLLRPETVTDDPRS